MYPATPRLIMLKFVYIIAFVFGALSVAQANDSSDNKPTPVEIEKIMTKARALIDEGELKKATRQLNKVVAHDKKNADAWNLLGYSWRKLDKTRKSKKAYARALKINPDHKGALEYQGVLFVKIGDIEKARYNHAKLEALCPSGCEELASLTQALAGQSSY